eukprot:4859816-Pleurochrysis_carterae.AAC.1
MLLLRWDSAPFSGFIFDSTIASVAPEAADSGPSAASASGASSLHADSPIHLSDDSGQVLGKVPEQNREKPPEAGSCTGASHIPFLGAGTSSSSISPAGSSNAVYPVDDAADGTATMPGIPHAAADGDVDADADADADLDADAPASAPATPTPLSAGRHAATYEL